MPKLYWKSDWVLASALSLAFLLVSGGSVLQSLERKAYDFGVSASHRDAGDKIAIIAIDDESIANIGRWPWPRDIQAKMLDKLAAAKPKVIGNTIFFLEPQIDPGLVYINKIANFVAGSNIASSAPQLNALILEAQTQLNTDATLAASMRAANNVVLAMPFVIGEPLGNPDAPFPAYIAKNQLTNIAGDDQDSAYLTPANAAFLPISVIAESATSVGHLNASPDIDGAIRAEPLVLNYYNQYYPSVALQIAAKYLNLSASDVTLQLGESGQAGVILGQSKSAQLKIATNRALQMNTFFYADKGNQPAFAVDSFYDVLNGKISAKKYAGKIVLIGATANGVGDSFVTPISANMKPIETLAHSVASILNEDFYLSPSWAIWAELAVWLLVAAYLILLFPRLKANHAALVTCGLLLFLVVAHYLLMTQKGWWLQLMMPISLLLIGHAALTTKRYLMTEKGKEKSDADSAESNRNLALMFQSQGQLDMAFDRFRKCPVDAPVMDGLYSLGLDFERKRQFNKAETVFNYMASHQPDYKDLSQRISRSKQMAETVVFGGNSGRTNESTLILNNSAIEKPMLGRYQVEKELGKGAMGVVYLGRDPKISRVVAIKTMALSSGFDADELEEVKARFFREAETAGRLNHPNIVTIYDAGEEHDLAYIAMEFLKGKDLAPHTKAHNLLPILQVLDIVIKVADALDYAHASNVVHRDIKPSNIMVELDTGIVKVTDFGIARITDASKTKTGIVLGTPSYMSPEQLSGKKIDGKSDLFSLGVTLYSLLTGELPFTADSMTALMYKIANEPHADIRQVNPELSEDLAMVINKMLEKNAENRYKTGKEVADDLRKCHLKVVKV
ncbi:MAG: serine/threonine protein kinase [Methylotenera sp.]|nr:MAG: serine/threonine protein kinase [Methylotenera sp.]